MPPESKPEHDPPAHIRVGVGGWTYAPWRNHFYPEGLPQAQELAWASRQLSSIEVNGTFYSGFKPATFAKWRDETPDDFVFSLKAIRYATQRKELATAGGSVTRFVESGISELGPKLGPLLWQFAPFQHFHAEDFEAFLALLPPSVDGLPMRHVLDLRHASFNVPECFALLRRYGCTAVCSDSDKYPTITDADAPLAYLRLMRTEADCPTGYAPAALDAWAQGARDWTRGTGACHGHTPRDVFVYFISGAKEQAPAAALALLERLKTT